VKIFTIGHSAHSFDHFVNLLNDQSIVNLVDVRTAPASRFHTHFNKEILEHRLRQVDVQYAFAGKYLGGRPSDPTCYKQNVLPSAEADYLHEVNYPEVMKRKWFIDGIRRLLELADEDTTAIMCSEEDPALCHRHHLIAKYILQEIPGVKVIHIRGDGNVFSAASLNVSVDTENASQLSFFSDNP
jgi:uncharacterized protein (DUF488 family)